MIEEEEPAARAWRTALLESSLDCVILMDGDGIVVDINAGTERTFGVERHRVIGRRLGEVFVPPEVRARHEAGLARYLTTGESAILGQHVEVEALHGSGERIPVELSIVRLQGAQPPLFVGHLRTISARLRSERRLRTSARAGAVLATSRSPGLAISGVLTALGEELGWPVVQYWRADAPSGTLILESSWSAPGVSIEPFRQIQVFDSGEGVPGETWAQAEPLWIDDIAAARDRLPRFDAVHAAGVKSALAFPVHVAGRVVAVIEAFRFSREAADPELLALLSALGGQLGHVIVVHEARRALEASESALREAVQQANDAREAAERANAAKDQFLAVISHELRTPLGPILGWAQLLQRDEVDAATRIKAAGAIRRNAELESRLIEDLLDVSRIVTGKLQMEREPVSMVQLVNLALETTGPAAHKKGVAMRFEGDFEVPQVFGDHKRLQQVIMNLLTNSIKFTPAGGEIRIALAQRSDAVELVVRDTGEGIAPEYLPRIFQRFEQGHRRGSHAAGGLGLGLAIVRDIVSGHGGSVTAASEGPGRGATFTVRLPVAASSSS